jgi:hypothetical protein
MHVPRSLLACSFALLALASTAKAVTLDTSGTGPEAWPEYFCRSPFDFQHSEYNKQAMRFTITLQGQCGVIQDPSKYTEGWGGGNPDFQIVDVYGTYSYPDGSGTETVRRNGQVILDTSFNGCGKNPWAYPFEATCAPKGNPVNNSGVAVHGPYPVSARYLETQAILALRSWEENKDKADPLENWDPSGTPPGYSALRVATPASYESIPAAAPGFSLALTGLPPAATGKVLMSWQNIVQGPELQGDIVVSGDARWDWWPFAGPPFAMAGSFPVTVSGVFTNKPGLYRVQVKLETETWWSPWRYFWIGPPQDAIPHGDAFSASAALRQKALFKTKVASLGVKTPSAAAPAAAGAVQPAPVKSLGAKSVPVVSTPPPPPPPPPAPTAAGGVAATKKVSAKQTLAVVPKAVVVVETVAFKPAPLTAGKAIDLSLSFKNSGTAASDPALQYSLSCTVKSGGPACPIPATKRPVSSAGLAPGESRVVTLAGASPATAGSYDLVVTVGTAAAKHFPFSVGVAKVPAATMKKSLNP